MIEEKSPLMVTILCITYNHKSYIRQCLDGFVKQKTNFRFEAIVHDDASTDGTTDIVREFAEKYPDIIKPMIEKENQYSKGKTSFGRTMLEHYPPGKYIAECEGDDYWIDPLKLQKQVDYMESHPECTMTCSGSKWFSERRNEFIADQYCQKSEGLLNPADIINRTGYYIPTCSIIYRPEMMNDYPVYCKLCPVGDWPMQIMAAMKGSVYYFNELMCVYRTENDTSWTNQQKYDSLDPVRLNLVKCLVKMFEGFSDDYPEYKIIFKDKVAEFICKNMPRWIYGKKDLNIYKEIFSTEISSFSLKWRLYYFISLLRLPLVKFWYRKLFLRRYILKVGDKLL